MQSRDQRIPGTVVELLRLCVVAFAAGLGYQLALLADPDGSARLGGLGTAQLGVVLGSGFGYVVGGMLGRSTVAAVSRTDAVLRDVPGSTSSPASSVPCSGPSPVPPSRGRCCCSGGSPWGSRSSAS